MTKEPLRYDIIIYWSAEDDAFLAEIPEITELAGCAADVPIPQEALANVNVVAHAWIETAREHGRTIPEPKGRFLSA